MDASRPISEREIIAMMEPMRHRGPDGHGIHISGSTGLGHLRLSIIDLATGAQPMANEDETVWIVFNGEIYNFQELREKLISKGHSFKSRSDTEVIIHLYEELGPDCVKELRGMFAFAIWDLPRRRLFLSRDRVGIKPLYFYQNTSTLWFASEFKGILADPDVSPEVNAPAIDSFLTHYFLPGDQTLFRGVKRLLPGHSLIVENGRTSIHQYWDLTFPQEPMTLDFEEAVEQLRELLRQKVRDHMISDVPVGFLASGGVDSTALLSFAVEQTKTRIQTFTIGFDGEQFADERPYARLAAERFGTRHHEISMSAAQFRDFLPSYVWHMEDPVCEPPAVALHYVSKLAREHVKVLLSGEGGDEAFGGYPNYHNQLILERAKSILGPLRYPAGSAFKMLASLRGSSKVARQGRLLGQNIEDHYLSRTSSPFNFFNAAKHSLYTADFLQTVDPLQSRKFVDGLHATMSGRDALSQMLYVDTKAWLPDDLLIKADKITMGNSLELRVPLLDHEVLEFAARVPSSYKVRGTETKAILKQAFKGVVPDEILNRKKTGFPVPYERWLRHDLKDFVRDTILSDRALSRGYFQKKTVQQLLDNSRNGSGMKEIFCLLTLELWHQRFEPSQVTENGDKSVVINT